MPLVEDRQAGWQSGRWFLREERCYLVPGDSPLGLRLPLDSLPWAAAADQPLDPRAGSVPDAASLCRAGRIIPASKDRGTDRRTAGTAPRTAFESAAWITRTAICAEPRNGMLYIFMPPADALEDYLELVAAVEATAAETGLRVIVEGYEPPRDPRLEVLRITPDPGVLEANVQPVKSWAELVENTTFLYDAAHLTRLTTEKFMVDGRHTGTGGGNHFVLGGPTAADSPVPAPARPAREPARLLAQPPVAVVPVLGPVHRPDQPAPARGRSEERFRLRTGSRLRGIDEAQGKSIPPWLVDRLFRNLLIDATGNTHRAEFSIDKMYSPDGPTGRLGLLELRGFEMPPHARMSLTQQLLMRALVARFWNEPYQPRRLVRWGTELHDRFMLPHFVWQDFEDVIDDTRREPATPCARNGSRRISNSASRASANSPRAARASSCAPRSSRGTCWARKAPPAAPRATWTPRWSACRCAPPASPASGTCSPATAARCRSRPPATSANSSPACATAPGSPGPRCTRPSACTRRSRSISSTPG